MAINPYDADANKLTLDNLIEDAIERGDAEAIEWLEYYLKTYKNAFIVVSHDREFINKIAETVYEVEYNKLYKYTGNYDNYLKEKETKEKKEK